MSVEVHHGDSREVLKGLAENSIGACCTDPPYALESIVKRFGKEGSAAPTGRFYQRAVGGFMGQAWDTGETAFDADFWREVYRVLKPGAWLFAFSATRTYHRLATAIEAAGFEVRDMGGWVYGSGVPKTSKDAARAIDGALGVETKGRRIGSDFYPAATDEAKRWEGHGTALKPALEPICVARKPLDGTLAQNLMRWGVGALNIQVEKIGDELVDTKPKGEADAWGKGIGNVSGFKGGVELSSHVGRWPANIFTDGSDDVLDVFGEATRFFYSAKADGEDRMGSAHPTVKPIDLMRHFVSLCTPPGETVLDPFAGTGSTGLAALTVGRPCVLIEREPAYHADILRRLAWARGEGRTTALETARALDPAKASGDDLPLFSGGV